MAMMNAAHYTYQDSTMIIASPWHTIRSVDILTSQIITECGNIYSGVELSKITFANIKVPNEQCTRCEWALAQIGQYA
jgi:hypothetical protein